MSPAMVRSRVDWLATANALVAGAGMEGAVFGDGLLDALVGGDRDRGVGHLRMEVH